MTATETTQSPHFDLAALRDALATLQAYGLPPNAQAALNTALKNLEALARHMEAGREQRRLAALYRVSHTLGTSLKLDEVLNQVMDAVIGLTGAERGFLMLSDHRTGETLVRAARNLEREGLDTEEMKVSRTVIQTVLESGEGLVTTDAQQDPRFAQQDSVVAYALRSILCAPLRTRGQVIGAIYVDHRAQEALFTRDDLELLNAFAVQAAVAIDNARLYTQTDQKLAARVSEMETLARVVRELSAHLDLDSVLEIARRWAVEGVGAQDGWLALQDAEDGGLVVMDGSHNGRALRAQDGFVAEALAAGTPHIYAPGEGAPARIVAPLLIENRPGGVLVVESPQPFPAEALQFIARLANHAAIAIEKALLYRDVQRVSDEKSKFVSVVTHELRIPMTSIKGYTDLLRQGAVGPVTEQQTEFLGVIRSNVERMSALVSDLADIARIETGRLPLEPQWVAVGNCVQEVLQSLRPRLEEKSHSLTVDVPAGLPRAYADPNRVVQVLNNLVSNACKYTPAEGRIEVSARPQDGFLRLVVRDDGIGIRQEEQPQIFSQFFRSEDTAVREEQGWGLGLNVTKRLVELMGGQIGFESGFGQGSAFWFTLPLEEAPSEGGET